MSATIIQNEINELDQAACLILSRDLSSESKQIFQPETKYAYSSCLLIEGIIEIGKEQAPRKAAGDATGTLGLVLDLLGSDAREQVSKFVRGMLEGKQLRKVKCSENGLQLAKDLIDLTSGSFHVSPTIKGSLRVQK